VAHYQDGLRVIDLADPTAPKLVAHANTYAFDPDTARPGFDGAYGVDVDPARQLVFVADSPGGLVILREE
jgi:hypothetical protein